MFRRFLSIFVLLLVLAIGILGVALNQTRPTVAMARALAQRNFPQVQIQSLTIGRQRFFFPDEFIFSAVKARAASGGETYTLEMEKFRVRVLEPFWRRGQKIQIEWKNADVAAGEWIVRGCSGAGELAVPGGPVWNFIGVVTAVSVQPERSFSLTDLGAVIEADSKQAHVAHAFGRGFGGQFTGDILLEYPPDAGYIIKLGFAEFSAAELKNLNPAAFDQMAGLLDGRLYFDIKGPELRQFSVDARMHSGAKMRASFLLGLPQLVPMLQGNREWEALARANSFVPVELASVQLRSAGARRITGTMNVASRRLNLQMDLPTEINYDGTVASLLLSWKKSFSP